MGAVFRTVLGMSVTGSYVILAVMLMRLILRRFPKKYSYALWAVAGFRLCCPISFSAFFSLFRLPYIQQGTTIPALQATEPEAAVPPLGTMVPGVQIPPQITVPAAQMDWLQILAVIWLTGVAAITLYSIWHYIRLKRVLGKAVKQQENVYRFCEIHSPFALGVLRPKIYLPVDMEAETAQHVLAHEKCHLKRMDHIVKLIAFGILTVHWFNPLCYVAFRLMTKDMEMSCDEAVLASGKVDKHDYSATLVAIAAQHRPVLFTPLAFGEGSIKSRVKNILNWKKPSWWAILLALTLCLCVALICVANPPNGAVQEGKYILLHTDGTFRYIVVEDNKVCEGAYANPKEHAVSRWNWKDAPFTQQQWAQLADPYNLGMKKPIPEQIEGCEYLDLGTVTEDLEVETAQGVEILQDVQTHTFLLRKDGQLFFCKTQRNDSFTAVRSWYMVQQWSEADPVGNGILELDSMVDRLIYTEGTQTTQISREKILDAISRDEALYKQIYSHRYVVQYLSHMFMEKGVNGYKEMFMGILFEKVLDRSNETQLVSPASHTATKTFTAYMQAAQQLYNQHGYSYMLAKYPVATALLLYLTNDV